MHAVHTPFRGAWAWSTMEKLLGPAICVSNVGLFRLVFFGKACPDDCRRSSLRRTACGGLRKPSGDGDAAADRATGGVARVSPSMREVPVSEPTSAVDFAHRLISGQIDIVLLMTGVGTRHLVAQVERHMDRARFLAALSDVTTVARGPKPVAALREFDIQPTIKVPEPNTWGEVPQDARRATATGQPDDRLAGVRQAEHQPGGRARSPRRHGSHYQSLQLGFSRRRGPAGSQHPGLGRRGNRRRAVYFGPPGSQPAAHCRTAGAEPPN